MTEKKNLINKLQAGEASTALVLALFSSELVRCHDGTGRLVTVHVERDSLKNVPSPRQLSAKSGHHRGFRGDPKGHMGHKRLVSGVFRGVCR